MNVNEFLALTKSSGRKLLSTSNQQRDIQIIRVGMNSLKSFFLVYLKKFDPYLSPNQKIIIPEIILLCGEEVSKNNFERLLSKLNEFSSAGINLLVRHPEPLLSSYELAPGRNLKIRGTIQVWRFNQFLKEYLEAYDNVKINFFCSDSKRTLVFADLCHHYLNRHSPQVNLNRPRTLPILSGGGQKIQDLKKMYPELKAQLDDGKPRNTFKLRLIKKYFKRWIVEAPLAEATANEINTLLNVFVDKNINIYFSHENVIGSYLYHKLNLPIDLVLIGFTKFIITSKNHIYIHL